MSKKQIEIDKRRNEVRNLKRIGLSNGMVASKLNISIRSVERDLNWLREKYSDSCAHIFLPEIIGETLSIYSEIEGLALAKAHNADKNDDLSKLLSVALKSRSEMVSFLFKLGTLYGDYQGQKEADIDISKMTVDELSQANDEIEEKIIEITNRIKRYNEPDPLDEYDWD